MTEHTKAHTYTVEVDGEHWKVVDRLGAFTGTIATTSTIYGANKVTASLNACTGLSNAALEAGVIEKMAIILREAYAIATEDLGDLRERETRIMNWQSVTRELLALLEAK